MPQRTFSRQPLHMSLSREALGGYVAAQMDSMFPDRPVARGPLADFVSGALDRLEYCFRHTNIKGFHAPEGPQFNHLHTDQYAIFLYFLANTAFNNAGLNPIAEKAYALNKALHGLDAFYEVELPDIFSVVHPVGTVLGRATYGDYFLTYHNVSVGADLDDNNPVFGCGVVMYGSSRVVGNVTVGSNCLISEGASFLTGSVPDGHVAFGRHPNVQSKPTRHNVIRDIFKDARQRREVESF